MSPRDPSDVPPPRAKPKARSAKPRTAKPKTSAPPTPLTDEQILAESSLDEVVHSVEQDIAFHGRQVEEDIAFRRQQAANLEHAQALAVAAARHQAPMDPAALKARNRRNIALALVLLAFVVLVFISTIYHLGGGAAPQP